MEEKINWHSEQRKLSELKPCEWNPRSASEKQYQDLDKSLTKFNLADPIIINQDNFIIGGHFRYKILKDKNNGKDLTVDVRVPNRKLSNAEMRELNIRLNYNTGEFNFDLLANFDEELLKDIGFENEELDKIFQLDISEQDDIIPEVKKTSIKKGDLFQLGNHRLLCGDCTIKENVERLMDGKKADMVFTDPPYNLAFIGGSRKIKFDKLINDDETNENWTDFITESLDRIKEMTKGDVYVCIDWRKYGEVFKEMNKRWKVYNCIIWVKNQLSMGRRYRFRHEFIIYADTSGAEWKGNHSETDVWEENKEAYKEYKHPTQKPVSLIVRALTNTSKPEDIIGDLFLGSGSTLIACEKTNRICYGMEISELYCETICKRWEDFTGLKVKNYEQ